MADTLTPQQEEAVKNRGGRLLVSAAAGSGKTKVLVDRLMRYLSDPFNPANVDDFLIITFTEAAAAELRGKIASKLTEQIAKEPDNKHLQKQMQRLHLAQISTIHAFCSKLLRDYAYKIDLSTDFRLADEKEAAELQVIAMDNVLEKSYSAGSESFYAFVDTQGLGRDDRLVPQIVLDIFKKAQCHMDPKGWLQGCLASADIVNVEDAAETVWGHYLIKELHELVDMVIEAFSNCIESAKKETMPDRTLKVLESDRDILRDLRNRNTWNEIFAVKKLKLGTLGFHKDFDSDLRFAIKETRDACKNLLAEKLALFTEDNARVLLDLQSTTEALHGLVDTVLVFEEEYNRLKRNRRVVDFTDLEHMTLDLLLGKSRRFPTVLAEEVGNRYLEIMVDEYQDTNEVQDSIFNALTLKRHNCFMVGDVKQSIYQFRLADPGIFIEKYNSYASTETAENKQGRKVLLSKNFRSSGGVISAVNDVFENCMSPRIGGLHYGKAERLEEGIEHISLNECEVELHCIDVQHSAYPEEADFVANRIAELLDGTHMVREGQTLRPIRIDDIVILLRAPKSSGLYFQEALELRGIPCSMESSTDLLETEEVAFLRAVLQIVSNPLQDIPLAAVLMSRIFGFTADEIAQIRAGDKKISLYDSVKNRKDEKTSVFLSLLRKLRYVARTSTVSQLLDFVISNTSMDSIYSAMNEGDTKKENIFAFCQLASSFESNKQGDLERFLLYLDNLEKNKGFTFDSDENAGAVQIMSIHKSKGLEFPVVFLSGISRSFSTQDQNKPVVCDRELGLGLFFADTKKRVKYPNIAQKAIASKITADQLSEELRILYVAMTRAKDRLIMTYARRTLGKHLTEMGRRMDFFPHVLMNMDVSSFGDWILQTAMMKPEAKALFDISVRPQKQKASEYKWAIFAHEGQINEPTSQNDSFQTNTDTVPEDIAIHMDEYLSYHYPYVEATRIASKQTATQLKGRLKDSEIAEFSDTVHSQPFRKPSFAATVGDAKTYGNVMHKAMQYITYGNCSDGASVSSEIQHLVERGILSEMEAAQVDCDGIAAFFASDLGKQIRSAPTDSVFREFKFSLLDDASRYVDGTDNEQILLQGIVDCALVNSDGITVIDFKTDYVTEDTLQSRVNAYSQQVNAYAYAMERIFEKKIQRTLLYFFRLKKFVEI